MRRVAVTGLGVVAPLGACTDELFTNLTAGRSGIRTLAAEPLRSLRSPIGAPVEFDGSTWEN